MFCVPFLSLQLFISLKYFSNKNFLKSPVGWVKNRKEALTPAQLWDKHRAAARTSRGDDAILTRRQESLDLNEGTYSGSRIQMCSGVRLRSPWNTSPRWALLVPRHLKQVVCGTKTNVAWNPCPVFHVRVLVPKFLFPMPIIAFLLIPCQRFHPIFNPFGKLLIE